MLTIKFYILTPTLISDMLSLTDSRFPQAVTVVCFFEHQVEQGYTNLLMILQPETPCLVDEKCTSHQSLSHLHGLKHHQKTTVEK